MTDNVCTVCSTKKSIVLVSIRIKPTAYKTNKDSVFKGQLRSKTQEGKTN